jgi:maleamate amidohydrolase
MRRHRFAVRELAESARPPILKAYLDRFAAEVQRFFPCRRARRSRHSAIWRRDIRSSSSRRWTRPHPAPRRHRSDAMPPSTAGFAVWFAAKARVHQKGAKSMTERIWDKFLTERDKAVFAAGGFGARAGFGKRPALLVIDVNWAFCGERPEPILGSIKRWRSSCGEAAWTALASIKPLIELAHAKGLPVIYTTGERRADNWDAGSWRWKSTRRDEVGGDGHHVDGNEIVALIAPGPRDIVIRKQKPSGFFGTNLAAYLTLLGCDSVVIVGTTTSGCVRASVVDVFSLNYRVILAEEGCFDRSEASHAVSLCDMHAKYADVVPTAEILAYFEQLPEELFELPSGNPRSVPPIRDAAE